MNKEIYPTWLVSPDIAKELKEIGFDEPCVFYDILGDITFDVEFKEENLPYEYEGGFFSVSIPYKEYFRPFKNSMDYILVSLPTWEQALAWFRAKGYYGNLEATSKGTSAYIYVPFLDQGTSWDIAYKESYEEAREALLLKLIDLYKTANQ